MSMSDDSAYAQFRIFAESCILRCIDEFDAQAQKRLLDACPGAPYKNADEALNDFESSQSLTTAHVEWVQNSWRDRKKSDPAADPQEFAADVAKDVFHEVDF